MSIVKVIEVIASSEKSIEDALQQAVAEASKTVRNIDSVYVKDIKAHVQDGKISSYGLICKISFRLDENNKPEEDTTAQAAEQPEQQLPQVPREETKVKAKVEEEVPENKEEEVSEPVNQKDFVPAH